DIDGTLAGYGGVIDRRSIELFLRSAHVGIVSSRPDCDRIARDLGLGYACCSSDKASCLRDYATRYPVPAGSIYIADMESDFKQAADAGWNWLDVNNICVNLGAGGDIRRGCLNVDVRVLPGIDYVMDIERDELPFPQGTVSTVLAYDVLEHISWRRVRDVLSSIVSRLKPGGKIHIRTPDVDEIYRQVVTRKDFRGDFKYRFEAISYWLGGGQDYPENTHRTFWDVEAMVELLRDVGLDDVSCKSDGGTNMICEATRR
ncbi:MAG: methyltransferase domain-containing protein, partial [Thermoproteus sp.]